MSATTHMVTIGRVGRAYGVQGWVKIHSYTEPYTNIIDYMPWFLYQKKTWCPAVDAECKIHGDGLIAHFKSCETPEETKPYVNLEIGVLREQLPLLPADTYYLADMIGLRVYNLQQNYLGKITHFFETGAHAILCVKKGKQECLIPLVMESIVVRIDLAEKLMLVDWQEDY